MGQAPPGSGYEQGYGFSRPQQRTLTWSCDREGLSCCSDKIEKSGEAITAEPGVQPIVSCFLPPCQPGHERLSSLRVCRLEALSACRGQHHQDIGISYRTERGLEPSELGSHLVYPAGLEERSESPEIRA